MSAKPNYFRVGVFILIGVALLVGGIIVLGAGQFFRPKIYIETYVDASVQGVELGTPVKFRGVQIGKVSQINFTFNEYGTTEKVDRYNYVCILMEIEKEIFPGMFSENLTPLFQKNIAQGMRVRIEPLGITGSNYMEINYLKDPAQFPPLEVNWTPHYYYIPSAPGQLTNILDSVNNMMREIEGMNLGKLGDNLNAIVVKLEQAVNDAQIQKVSQGIQDLMADFRTALNDAKLGELSGSARQLMSELEKSNAELNKILKNIEPSTHLNPEEIKAIVKNLADTTANLESFSYSVKQRPSSLLWGSPPKPKPSPTPKRR